MKRNGIIIGTFLLLSICLGVGLTYLGLRQNLDQKISVEKSIDKMTIAIVNEDEGTIYGDNEYYMGANYIKKIEQDNTQNWYVVSRGVAESGLNEGTYNLMIVIPNDFSQRVMGIDEVAPEQAVISYRINENGNKDISNAAERVAEDIIKDLNKDLTDVFFATVIDNLYTAQKNISYLVDNSKSSLDLYTGNVYTPIDQFKNQMSVTTDASTRSEEQTQSLKKVLESFNTSFDNYSGVQNDYYTNQTEFSNQQNQNTDTVYEMAKFHLEDFQSQMISEDTNALYAELQAVNSTIQTEFSAGVEETLAHKINTVDTTVQAVTAETENKKAETEARLAAVGDEVDSILNEKYAAQLNNGELTLDGFLQNGLSSGENDTAANLNLIKQKEMEALVKLYTELKALPSDMASNDSPATAATQAAYQRIQNYPDSYSMLNQLTGGELATQMPNPLPEFTLLQNLKDATNRFNNANGSYELETGTIGFDSPVATPPDPNDPNQEPGPTPTSTLTVGYDSSLIRVDKVVIDGTEYDLSNGPYEGEIAYTANSKIVVSYSIPKAQYESGLVDFANAEILVNLKYSDNTSTFTETLKPSLENHINALSLLSEVKAAEQRLEEYMLNLEKQTETMFGQYIAGGTNSFYRTADDGSVYSIKPIAAYLFYDDLLDTPVLQILANLLLTPLTASHESYLATFSDFEAAAQDMQSKSGSLTEQLDKVLTDTENLNTEVAEQLANLENWRKEAAKAITNNQQANTTIAGEHQRFQAFTDQMKGILSQSESMKQLSEGNITFADQTLQVFGAFSDQTKNVVATGENLNVSADNLLTHLNGELTENENFSQTFNTVLANSQRDGVINDDLVSFLSSPITETKDNSVVSGNTYFPYMTIIVCFVTAIFTAYVLSTQLVKERVDNAFKSDNFIVRNISMVGIAAASAIIEGLIIGILSSKMNMLDSKMEIGWVIRVVLIQLIFVLLATYLTRQLKMLGMFIVLALFTIYIFFTDAVGSVMDASSGLVSIRNYSPLYISENFLSEYLMGNKQAILQFVILGLVILSLIIFNLVVWMPEKKIKMDKEDVHEAV